MVPAWAMKMRENLNPFADQIQRLARISLKRETGNKTTNAICGQRAIDLTGCLHNVKPGWHITDRLSGTETHRPTASGVCNRQATERLYLTRTFSDPKWLYKDGFQNSRDSRDSFRHGSKDNP
ncbi:hypothetical protein SKAU_G00356420 [Synaphobranchus kaupii]|uniref:Uncharacterized protein n=1 Tax=Synaphobranchus kaupii TaxID=118154 RepID=A0A9Q1EHE9_SYNKA|nr:hypothetical protein SKAU_G00356420 [Synaphobranchus kaupii]